MDPGVELDLVPNQYYDDQASERSDVVIKAFGDAATMQQAFESGELILHLLSHRKLQEFSKEKDIQPKLLMPAISISWLLTAKRMKLFLI